MSNPKCPTCGKTAYPAESLQLKGNTYHTACFKCAECGLRLTLKTFKVSDFGQSDIYCNKCVPKIAPSQAAESIEVDRVNKASDLTRQVRIVNEQVRGAEETVGKSTSAVPNN